MNLLQNQTYNLWFNWLATKLMEWRDAKPLNNDLRNSIKAINEIGMFTNMLQTELEVMTRRYENTRADKNKQIQKLREDIEELENKLKQFEI